MTHQAHYRPFGYFALTFAATFALWFAGAHFSFQEGQDGLYILLMLPGLMAPFLVSLVMMARAKGSGMMAEFWHRLVSLRRIQLSTLPAMFLLMPIVVLVSIGISLFFGGAADQLEWAKEFSFSSGAVPVLLMLMMAATFEELGWRGYAFDSLQSRFTFLGAALLFSLLWSAWHLPLLFVNGSYQYEIFQQNPWFALNFYVGIIPMGVIISWVCAKNNKSVLAAVVFHFVINICQEALSMTQATKCIETGVLTLVATALIASDMALFNSRRQSPAGEARYAG